MIVNGLKLPSLLLEVISNNKWKVPEDTRKLKEITMVNNPQYFNFLNLDRIDKETNNARALFLDGFGSIYNIDSSEIKGENITDLSVLDIDKSVMIIVNDDEQAIFLDYRHNESEPTVVYQNPEGHWVTIANSFEEFVVKIGLI
jgi:hypothetical protein